METKQHLRARVLARRDALPKTIRLCKSTTICNRLEYELSEALSGAGLNTPTVAVFSSMRSEVTLQPFIEAAYARGWMVCFPCMMGEGNPGGVSHMTFFRVTREQIDTGCAKFLDSPMRQFSYATLEHDGFCVVAPDELDAVIVPLVAFDNEDGRLGYGGGNYDRLLPLLRADAVVIGVAFDEQRVEAVPREPHDQPLSRVISA